MGLRARLLFACLATAVLWPAAPVGAGETAGAVVWVIDSSTRAVDPPWVGGLWHVSVDGERERILGRKWHPLAPSSRGPIAAVPSEDDGRRHYWIVRSNGDEVRLLRATKAPPCAAWSGDGELLSFLVGESVDPRGIVGDLWVVSLDDPGFEVLVAGGRFPECPAWSPTGRTLAFLREGDADRWEVTLFDGDMNDLPASTDKIDTVDATAAQGGVTKHRSFDWSPDGDTLAWVGGRSIRVWKDGTKARLTEPGALRPVLRRSEGHRWRSLRFSPDGQMVAAGVGYGAGIFQRDGDPLRYARGVLRGWAGNAGILTARPLDGVPSLLLNSTDPEASPRVIQTYSKQPVVTHPGGRWFAYLNPDADALLFKRPDGELIRRVDVGDLRPGTPGVETPDGHFAIPPWP